MTRLQTLPWTGLHTLNFKIDWKRISGRLYTLCMLPLFATDSISEVEVFYCALIPILWGIHGERATEIIPLLSNMQWSGKTRVHQTCPILVTAKRTGITRWKYQHFAVSFSTPKIIVWIFASKVLHFWGEADTTTKKGKLCKNRKKYPCWQAL